MTLPVAPSASNVVSDNPTTGRVEEVEVPKKMTTRDMLELNGTFLEDDQHWECGYCGDVLPNLFRANRHYKKCFK